MPFHQRFELQFALVFLFASAPLLGDTNPTTNEPQWIWSSLQVPGKVPTGAYFFRRTFELDAPREGVLEIAADDTFEVFVNGQRIGRGAQWQYFTRFDVSDRLVEGRNSIAVKVVNRSGDTAGLAVRLVHNQGQVVTDSQWKCSAIAVSKWQQTRFLDTSWKPVLELGPWGETQPWVVQPLPSARRIAALNSATKPARAEFNESHGPEIVTVAAEEEVSAEPRKPLLLRPLRENFPWLKKRSHAARSAANAIPTQALSTAREIKNPHFDPSQTQVAPAESEPPSRVPNPKLDDDDQTAEDAPMRRFQTQTGFAVEQVLPGAKTGSLISVTFNEFGQILAGQEDGPLLLISDRDDDHQFDDVRSYGTQVKNCHGILALSGMVFVVAEGPQGTGLYRLSDNDRDGQPEKIDLLAAFEVDAKEHGPHGIVLGPDGKLYVSVGNHAKSKTVFAKSSPRRHLYEGDLIPRYEDPGGHASGVRLPAGFILRTDIHGKEQELFASGLRNAYDLAFNADAQLFTADSDMEADQGTNWYRPTRLYHVLPGSEFGWRSGWAKWPDYYHDVVPPVAETGRGSPTGIVFYNHNTYPSEYHNAAFVADWSSGRILKATFAKNGAGYAAETDTFVQGKPLNVTDIEVGPDGLLYFATGGRNTKGGVYRVTCTAKAAEPLTTETIGDALKAPQIHSSWGRQRIAAIQQKLGGQWNPQITAAVKDASLPVHERLQALQLMQWVGPIPSTKLLIELSQDRQIPVRRLAAYFLQSSSAEEAGARLLELLSDADPTVRRQACESLVDSNRSVPYAYLTPLLSSTDRFEVWSARRLLALDQPEQWQTQALAAEDLRTFIQAGTALMVAWPTKDRGIEVANRAAAFLQGYVSDPDFVDLLRLLQLAVLRGELELGDIPAVATTLAEEFPANDHEIMNRELSRLLVRLQVTSIKARYLEYLETDLPDAERIHLATHLVTLDADWETDEKLLLLSHLTSPADASAGVRGYLENVARDFGKKLGPDVDRKLIQQGSEQPELALQAVLRLPQSLTLDQIKDLTKLDRSVLANDPVSKKLKVAILAILARDGQDASMAYLRDVYDREPARRYEVAIGLAEHPGGENWEYLVRSLPLFEGEDARELIRKLCEVSQTPKSPEPYRQVIMMGENLGPQGGDDAVRLLEHWRGFAATDDTPPWNKALQAWRNWYATTYPEALAPQVEESTTATKWNFHDLLHQVNHNQTGSAERGRLVFEQAKCASCHQFGDHGEPMGPNLTTVGQRFLTKEILDSIVHPSRVISDQYRAKTLVTHDGQSYTGIVGAGGQDELVVLQADGTKVHLPKSSVEQTVPSKVSAMPAGLIDSLDLQQVLDLMAFLKETSTERLSSGVNQPVSR